jgi:hypothetical protein
MMKVYHWNSLMVAAQDPLTLLVVKNALLRYASLCTLVIMRVQQHIYTIRQGGITSDKYGIGNSRIGYVTIPFI